MAKGANIVFDDRDFRKAINKYIVKIKNKRKLLKQIGAQAQGNIEEHFRKEIDSRNARWKGLQIETVIARAKKRGKPSAGILKDTGALSRINFDVKSNKSVLIGTGVNYGGTHNFGNPKNNIPQREWLYINDKGKKKILAVTEDFYRDEARKAKIKV